MFGKKPVLTPSAAYKQLLVAESEINRELLVRDWQAVSASARVAAQQTRRIGSVTLCLAALAGGFSLFRRLRAKPADEKPSWLSLALKGIRLGWSLWTMAGAKQQSSTSATPAVKQSMASR